MNSENEKPPKNVNKNILPEMPDKNILPEMPDKLNSEEIPENEIRKLMAKRGKTKAEIEEVKLFLRKKYKTDKDRKILKNIFEKNKKISFSNSDFIASLIMDVQRGFSPVVVVSGQPRKGKTTFSAIICNHLSNFLYFENFDYEKNYIFDPVDILRNIKKERNIIQFMDEAGALDSGVGKFDFFTRLSKVFSCILQTQGFLSNVYILTLPFTSDITTDVRKYANYICVAKKRGVMKIFRIEKNEGNFRLEIQNFRRIFIEELYFSLNDVSKEYLDNIEKKCRKFKEQMLDKMLSEFETDKEEQKEQTYKWLKQLEAKGMLKNGN